MLECTPPSEESGLGCKEASFCQGLWWSKIPRGFEDDLID